MGGGPRQGFGGNDGQRDRKADLLLDTKATDRHTVRKAEAPADIKATGRPMAVNKVADTADKAAGTADRAAPGLVTAAPLAAVPAADPATAVVPAAGPVTDRGPAVLVVPAAGPASGPVPVSVRGRWSWAARRSSRSARGRQRTHQKGLQG